MQYPTQLHTFLEFTIEIKSQTLSFKQPALDIINNCPGKYNKEVMNNC